MRYLVHVDITDSEVKNGHHLEMALRLRQFADLLERNPSVNLEMASFTLTKQAGTEVIGQVGIMKEPDDAEMERQEIEALAQMTKQQPTE